MIQKQRGVSGRTRVTPRAEWRAPAAAEEARLAEAGRVARRFVAARWPELAEVTPVATARHGRAPSADLLARLGLAGADLAAPAPDRAYTFTFAAERCAGDDATTPMVANVTVDARLRVVKTSVSR